MKFYLRIFFVNFPFQGVGIIVITFNLFLISFWHYWFPRTILNLWHWSRTKSSDGVQSFHKKGWHCQPPHPTQPTSANPFYANLPVGVFFTVGVFAFCKPSSCQVTPPIVTPQIKGEYMQLHSNVSEQCESVRFTVFPQQLVQSMSENTVQCKILNSQMQYIQCNATWSRSKQCTVW